MFIKKLNKKNPRHRTFPQGVSLFIESNRTNKNKKSIKETKAKLIV